MKAFAVKVAINERFGPWHEGTAFDVKMTSGGNDTYPNKFVNKVMIRNRADNTVYTRRGYGGYIGNHSYTHVNFRGQRILVTEILRLEK